MKIRYGHVSNSSTSSFIIVGKEAPTNLLSESNYIQLNRKQIKQVKREVDGFKCKRNDKVFLTVFFSDCSSIYDRLSFPDQAYYVNGWSSNPEDEQNDEVIKFRIYDYADGSWGGPYGGEDYFINLNGLPTYEGIWIRRKK